MSQENVELFHKGMEAFLRHDIEPLLETSHPEIEWYPFSAQVEGDVAYRGHEGVRRWWANLNATFEEFEASIDQVRDEGDVVMALGRLRARFRGGDHPGYRSRLGAPLPRWPRRVGSRIPKP